jgi:hypothetical protein
MRGETQATHLEEMMREHPLFSHFELVLPPVQIKRSLLQKLNRGDIVLLHLPRPRLQLHQEGRYVADLQMEACQKRVLVKHIQAEMKETGEKKSKKHEMLFCSFGSLQSRELKEGMKLDITAFDMERVILSLGKEARAEGRLVWVDEEMAVEITKVVR